ncbi:MAG TPA: CbiX/SirB N-terminal domain-containing protein [Pseudonocardiaceae bacterium]|nr:CbiX/SirB N-terminal domain-containing protein [Pseudonocardiaceae bacterium]
MSLAPAAVRITAAPLVLVAHGTRDRAGTRVGEELLRAVRAALPDTRVELAFADVHGPTVTAVLAELTGPAVVLPLFLAAGYHVRTDLPTQLAGFPDVTVVPALGPAWPMVTAVADRLTEAGWRPGDRVVLAAAGSSDPHARADVRTAAARLSALLDTSVHIGHCTTAKPALARVVATARRGGRRVAVASWLLAPGLFHRIARTCGADLVSEPIGAHPNLIAHIADHRHAAVI